MQENNPPEFLDDKEIEVVEIGDLPEDSETKASKTKKVSLAPRFSLKQRKRQALLTISIALITLFIFLANAFPLGAVFTLLSKSILNPTPQRLSGPDLFYFQSLPSWGSFTIDGRRLAQAPTIDSGPPVKLAPGEHLVEWYAEPFVPLSCTLAVDSSKTKETCRTWTTGANEYTKDASVIEFPSGLSLNQLPNAERQELTRTIQSFLDDLQSSAIVQPGERYAYNQRNKSSFLATKNLRATQRFLLDTNTNEPATCEGPRFGSTCSKGDNDCRLLCTLNWPADKGNPPTGWNVATVIRPTWEYTPLDGSTLAPDKRIETRGDQYIVTLQVTRTQKSWHVSFHPQGASSFDDPNCIATIGLILSRQSYLTEEKTQQRVTWTFSSGSNRASGCLAEATLHSGATLESPISRTVDARVFYRFGMLVAADDNAHRLWPALPIASKQAQGIAQEIGDKPAFVS